MLSPHPPARAGPFERGLSKRARDLFDLEALDDVALFDIVVILERHAAFETFAHFADFVLEALQGLQRAFMDHDVVTQQAHFAAALHEALRHHAARDFADLRDVEDFADLGIAEETLAPRRR